MAAHLKFSFCFNHSFEVGRLMCFRFPVSMRYRTLGTSSISEQSNLLNKNIFPDQLFDQTFQLGLVCDHLGSPVCGAAADRPPLLLCSSDAGHAAPHKPAAIKLQASRFLLLSWAVWQDVENRPFGG